MNKCPRCDGFLPSAASSCPNCRSRIPTWLKVSFATLAAGAAGVTLSACYGAPCTARLPDGGVDYDSCSYNPCNNGTLADGGAYGKDPAVSEYYNCKGDGGTDAGTSDGG
ncbi:MAG: hypothetical protein ACT4TC_09780 [Myxococcaceae bacterium]